MAMYNINLMGGTKRPRTVKRLARSYVNLELALLKADEELQCMALAAGQKSQLQRAINLQSVARFLRDTARDCGRMVELHRSLNLARIGRGVNVVACDGNWVEIVREI